jgi:predicted aspartyl protease
MFFYLQAVEREPRGVIRGIQEILVCKDEDGHLETGGQVEGVLVM